MIPYERGASWLSMVLRIQGSVLPLVWPRILVATLVAVAVTYLHRFDGFRLSLTLSPFLITGLPLGIILGFRNASSYDRFWEGRKLWGALVNSSRSFVRQLEGFVVSRAAEERDAVERLRRDAAYRLIAFAYALRMHLRREHQHDELAPLLDASEREALRDEACPPAALLHRLGGDLRSAAERGWLDARHAMVLEGTLTSLTDVVGGCERIKNTPTPISYIIFIHRAVAFYCLLLPFGVIDTVHSLTPVVVFFVSYALFCLDAIGDELDDPFRKTEHSLPIGAIARSVEIYVRRRLGEKKLPAPLAPEGGVLG